MESSQGPPIPPPLPTRPETTLGVDSSTIATFCAGLPYAGQRPLDTQELALLKRRSRRATSMGCLFPVLPPALAIVACIVSAFLIRDHRGDALWAAIAFFLILGIIATAMSLLRSRDLLVQGNRLAKIGRAGYVRRFQGRLGWFDPTDASLHFLLSTGLIKGEPGSVNVIELLADRDEIYMVNGSAPQRQIRLIVTSASVRPTQPSQWNVPKAWLAEGMPENTERRRPSPDELEELAEYGRLSRDFWVKSALRVVLYTPLAAYGLSIFFLGIADKLAKSAHLTFSPIQAFLRILVSAILVAVVLVGIQVDRRVRMRRRIEQELELGWIIIEPTTVDPPSGSTQAISGPTIEYFPLTNLLWTIDGKPAAWRYNVKAQAGQSIRK